MMRMRTKCLIFFLFTTIISYKLSGQPPVWTQYPPSSACGIINPTISVITPSPVCYQSDVTIVLKYSIPLDFLYITFGDGQSQTIANPPQDSVTVVHQYNLSRPDSCLTIYPPGQPGIACPITAHFYKTCGTPNYSYTSTTLNSLVFRFKPRARLFGAYAAKGSPIICCSSDCVSFFYQGNDSCTNTYLGTDNTDYVWSYGDGSANLVVNNTTSDLYQIPSHCYAQPASSPGYYVFKLHAENDCGVSEDSVKVYIQKIDTVTVSSGPYCTGSPVQLHITASGGLGNTTYNTTIFPAPGNPPAYTINGAGGANPSVTFTQPGQYTITAGYGACIRPVIIDIDQGVNLTQTQVPDLCFTPSGNFLNIASWYASIAVAQSNHFVVIDSSSGSVIFDSTINTTIPNTSILLANPGTYTIDVTSITSCNTKTNHQSFVVTPQGAINLPADTSLCLQEVYTLPVIPSGWVRSLNGLPYDSATFYVYPAGAHHFVYQPSCGSSATFTINSIGSEANCGSQSFCFNPGAINLTGTQTNIVYTDANGFVANNIFDGNSAGPGSHYIYSSFIDNVSGCTFKDTCAIDIAGSLNATDFLVDTACVNSTVSVTNINPALSYTVNWGDGMVDNLLEHSYTTAGTFLISDTFYLNGCDTVLLHTIEILPAPNPGFYITPDTLCNGDTATISQATSTPVYYNSVWTYQNVTSSTPPTIIAANNTTLVIADSATLSISSAFCPTVSNTVPVYYYPGTKAILALAYDSACSPLSVTILNNSIVSSSGARYQWLKNGVIVDSVGVLRREDTLYATNADKTDTFSLIVCSCGKCDTAIETITVHPVNFTPVVYVSSFSPCRFEKVTFSAAPIPGCTVAYNFGDGISTPPVPSDSAITHTYLTNGDFMASLTMYCACKSRGDSLVVHVQPGPDLTITAPTDTCSNKEITYTAHTSGIIAPVSYTTHFGDSTYILASNDPTPTHVYTSAGLYNCWMIVQGTNGCYSDTANIAVMVHATPADTMPFIDTFACSSILTLLKADTLSSGNVYQWFISHNADIVKATSYDGVLPFFEDEPGVYTVILTAYNNNHPACAAVTDSFKVTVYPSPTAYFSVAPLYIADNLYLFEFNNKSTPTGNTYFWDFGDSTFSHEVSPDAHGYKSGQRTVILTARNGACQDMDTNLLDVNPYLQLFLPNIFTPNNDGVNDYFEMNGNTEDLDFIHLKIFDRIGETVFDTYNLNFKWDGVYKDIPLKPAVYVYTLELSAIADPDVRYVKGSITLIR